MRDHDFIWWNGALGSLERPNVHVTSETALRGLNVFEGLRAYWRRQESCYAIVALEAHLDRLEQSARLLHIPIAYLRARLDRGIHELLLAIPNPSDLTCARPSMSKLEVTR